MSVVSWVGGLWTLEELFRGNGVIRRTQKVIQGDDNGHVACVDESAHHAQYSVLCLITIFKKENYLVTVRKPILFKQSRMFEKNQQGLL